MSRPDDRGAGLVEMLVVMLVSSILFTVVGATFTSSLRLSQRATSQNTATADARLVLDTISRRLRVAVRPPGAVSMILRAEPGRIAFYASLGRNGDPNDPAPTRVEYFYDTCLREVLTVGTPVTDSTGWVSYTWPATSGPGRCLVHGQVDADATGLFAYHEAPDGTVALPLTTAPSTDAVRNSIRSVGVRVAVLARGSTGVGPTRARTRVNLLNRLSEDAWRK